MWQQELTGDVLDCCLNFHHQFGYFQFGQRTLRQTLHCIMRCSCAAAGHAGQTQQSGESDLILFCFSERVDKENAQMDVRRTARHRSREVDERGELEERRTVVRDAAGQCYSDISLDELVCYSVIFRFRFFKTYILPISQL